MKKIYIIFITLLVLGIGAGAYYITEYRQSAMDMPKNVVMEGAYGTTYDFSKLEPKVRLIEFIYTNCPDICPNTTFKMKNIREKLEKEGLFGSKVEFLTITVDPKRDTAQKLRDYGAAFTISDDNGWLLLRGSEKDTKKLADAFDFKYRDPGNGMIIHTSSTYFLDEKNRVVEVFGMGEKGFKQEEVFKKIMKTAGK